VNISMIFVNVICIFLGGFILYSPAEGAKQRIAEVVRDYAIETQRKQVDGMQDQIIHPFWAFADRSKHSSRRDDED